jgi:dolichol kinase
MEETLKQKHDVHWGRKIWHSAGISFMILSYNFWGERIAWFGLGLTSLAVVPVDLLRQTNPRLNKIVLRYFSPIMRRHEAHAVSGMSYLLVGTIILLAFFSHHIINIALLFLAFGDPIASYFGIRFGKDKIIGNKTLQGTVAAFVVCTLIAGLYYYFNNIMLERLWIVAPLSGLIGALAELVPVGKLDDNFTFPVVSAICLWGLFQLFGGFGL